MNRDGAKQSLWQATEGAYAPRNAWNKSETYDVLIVGGGITGITTAMLLQEAGKKCIVAEAHNLAFGTTGGTTAHLNTLLDTPYYKVINDFGEEDAKQVAMASREAIDLIEGLISKHGIDCGFEYKTGFIFAQTDEEVEELIKIKNGNDAVNVMSEWSEILPLPVSFKQALKVDFQAQLHATKYVHALAHLFEAAGGVILEHCLVDEVVENDEGVEAETSLGKIKATTAVYATHLPPGINIFSFRCAPYRSYAMACTLKSSQYPDGLVYDLKDPYNYYRCQVVDGKSYLIAGGFDHKTGHNKNTEHVFTELEAHVRHIFDVDEVAYRWSSQFYESADGLPYIGLMPGSECIYVATGFGGNGMTLGSLSAKLICSLITGNEPPCVDVFDPSRIKMVAGFTKFVKENADVAAQFVGKRFSIKKLNELAGLAPGDATIAEWEGNKVALYKDDNGQVHAVNPTCRHAGCIVTWNSAEKTWDCPCHGTRYAPNGDLLTGPATRDLEQIIWEDIEGD
jgi:glycine/D-amino acid oxidase-like deaminating enzyme/nitrite reductase/ring-hydroxylating ferredoxin subunit